MKYENDHTVGHREYWQEIYRQIRENKTETPINIDNLTDDELELLTRPEIAPKLSPRAISLFLV